MRRVLVALAASTLILGGVAFATPGNGNGGPPIDPPGLVTESPSPTTPGNSGDNPGSPGDDCSHGASDQDCREDPNENGQDCEDHGNASGNEDHCLPTETTTTTTTTVPPPCESPLFGPGIDGPIVECPTTTTTTAPPPVKVTPPSVPCPGDADLLRWYGDPQANIRLEGEGSFRVRGGWARVQKVAVFTTTLDCDEVFVLRHYKVKAGHYLRVFIDGVLVIREKPPTFN